MVRYIGICLFLFVYACQEKKSEVLPGVEWLYNANPSVDFQAAINRGDYRFYGIYDYSLRTPGISIQCLDPKDINPIAYTTDATSNYRERKFNAVALVYAEEYNGLMKFYLERNMGFVCAKN